MKTPLSPLSLSLALFAAALLAACGSTPPAKLYTLEAQATATRSAAAASGKRRIELVGVRIPDLWDRPQIVTSRAGGEVDLDEFNRWAVPLKAEVPRVVARNLARLLDTDTVWLRDDFPGARPELRVQVAVERIEAYPGQQLSLEASWIIRDGEPASTQRVGRATFNEALPAKDQAAVATATSRALLALSEALAREIAASPQR